MMDINGNIPTPKGATHRISVCDTFNYEDYMVFAFGGRNLEEKERIYSKDMQRINSIEEISYNNW